MEIVVLILGIIAILIGVLGSILPVLPGPTASWLGLILLNWSGFGSFSTQFLIITFVVAILSIVLDYIIPAAFVKRWGGSKFGQYGATIGVIVGVFVGPLGIVFGSFVGAYIGELIYSLGNTNAAFRSAMGSFFGFLFGTGIKLMLTVLYAWFFIQAWLF